MLHGPATNIKRKMEEEKIAKQQQQQGEAVAPLPQTFEVTEEPDEDVTKAEYIDDDDARENEFKRRYVELLNEVMCV